MPNLNHLQIIGHAGSDPQLRSFGDRNVASFSVATTHKYGQGENKKEETTWVRVSAWAYWSNYVMENIRKGDSVFVDGRLSVRNYKDKTGAEKTSVEIVPDVIVKLAKQERSYNGQGSTGYTQPARNNQTNTDDDIPF